jgi:hypothetical protein
VESEGLREQRAPAYTDPSGEELVARRPIAG